MPKIKPHKGVKKRMRLTARGKIKRRRAFGGHLMSGKSGKRRRALRRSKGLSKAVETSMKGMLGAH